MKTYLNDSKTHVSSVMQTFIFCDGGTYPYMNTWMAGTTSHQSLSFNKTLTGKTTSNRNKLNVKINRSVYLGLSIVDVIKTVIEDY